MPVSHECRIHEWSRTCHVLLQIGHYLGSQTDTVARRLGLCVAAGAVESYTYRTVPVFSRLMR